MVDTNCKPDGIDYIIPGNDDAIRSIRLYAETVADAIIEGRHSVATAPVAESDDFVEMEEEKAEALLEKIKDEVAAGETAEVTATDEAVTAEAPAADDAAPVKKAVKKKAVKRKAAPKRRPAAKKKKAPAKKKAAAKRKAAPKKKAARRKAA